MPEAVPKEPEKVVIKPVRIAPTIATVFDKMGNTRDAQGRPIDRRTCILVGDRPHEDRYTASPGTARDLEALAAELAPIADFRVRCVMRSNSEQAELYRQYSAWVAAGRPKPGTSKWDGRNMRTDAASAPNRSHHGWGGAMDIGISALRFYDGRQGDAALAAFWPIAARHGFTPIISEPRVDRSESWHFDHLGPLREVREMFRSRIAENAEYASAHAIAAEVGCILLGTHTGTLQMERYVQARLLIGGHWCGLPDGKIGNKTRAALKAIGIDALATSSASELIAQLDLHGVGVEQLKAL